MKEVERIGLLKMDFLGPQHADADPRLPRARSSAPRASTLDIDTIPLDDPKTYKLFGDGAAYGIFQFESSGMRELLRKAKPERLDDLIALNALYRPGPLKSGMVDDWVARKQGRTEVKYELPQLEPILSDTYGVIAYQEQVMRIAQALAGFRLGQADVLRKAMGKKDPKVMAKQREAFMEGARAKGINEKKATKIFDLMEYFAGYGFNKSHSTAYAFLAYQTAYLKANYPWHFAAALLTIEAQNTDKLAMYLAESRDRGIPVLPPDINESQLHFSVEHGQGRPLRADRDQGPRRGRDQRHPRRARDDSADGFRRCTRSAKILDLRIANKRVFEALVKSGACDSLVGGTHAPAAARTAQRRSGLGCLRPSTAPASTATGSSGTRTSGQVDLFGGGDDGALRSDDRAASRRAAVVRDRAADLREGDARPLLDAAIRSIATPTTSGSTGPRRRPTSCQAGSGDRARRGRRQRGGRRRAGRTARHRSRLHGNGRPGRVAEDISIGGIVSGLRPLKTRKGDRMCVFMLDDAAGSIEVVVFPEAFKQYGHSRRTAAPSWCTGGSSATTSRCGSWRPRSCRSRWCGSGWPSRWRSGCRCRRTVGRRSSGCSSCSRSTRATGVSRSSSSSRTATCA